MKRVPEAERMDTVDAAGAYALADFDDVNARFVEDAVTSLGRPGDVLDLGCGPGDIPIALAGELGCRRLVAVDAASAMLDWARERVASSATAGRIRLVQTDAKRLPFPDAAFDAAVSNSILHHVAKPAAFWREAARVTSIGGRIFMRDLMRPDSIGDAERIVDEYAEHESQALRGEFFRSLCAAYTLDEVREQLEEAGLAHLDVRVSSDRHLDVCGVIR